MWCGLGASLTVGNLLVGFISLTVGILDCANNFHPRKAPVIIPIPTITYDVTYDVVLGIAGSSGASSTFFLCTIFNRLSCLALRAAAPFFTSFYPFRILCYLCNLLLWLFLLSNLLDFLRLHYFYLYHLYF